MSFQWFIYHKVLYMVTKYFDHVVLTYSNASKSSRCWSLKNCTFEIFWISTWIINPNFKVFIVLMYYLILTFINCNLHNSQHPLHNIITALITSILLVGLHVKINVLNEWVRHIKFCEQIYFKYLKVHPSESLCVCTSPPTQHLYPL